MRLGQYTKKKGRIPQIYFKKMSNNEIRKENKPQKKNVDLC